MSTRSLHDRKKAHGAGILAERAAVVRLKGYRVLARRYHIRGGEIDIVARRGDTVATVAFVEVKVWPTLDEAKEAIGVVKRRRISRAARRTLAPLTWRGDAVYVAPWRWPCHQIAAIELALG